MGDGAERESQNRNTYPRWGKWLLLVFCSRCFFSSLVGKVNGAFVNCSDLFSNCSFYRGNDLGQASSVLWPCLIFGRVM